MCLQFRKAFGPCENGCNINTLRLRQNGHRFPDDIFNCTFLSENIFISNKISLKFVRKGPINKIPALAPARRQAIVWINDGQFSDAYMHHSAPVS